MRKEGLKMDLKKKTKRIYHVRIDVVDDIEKFMEETGDKSNDITFIPDNIMLIHIEKAIKRFGKMEVKGVYITNSEVRIPILNDEEKEKIR